MTAPVAETARLNRRVPSWRVHEVPDLISGRPGVAVLMADNYVRADGVGAVVGPGNHSSTFHELLESRWLAHGRRAADRAVALDFGDYTFSFGDLIERSSKLAAYFRANGVRPGMTIGVLLERSLDAYAVQLAVSKAGCTFVPLDAAFPAERVNFILRDSEAAFLVTTGDVANSTAEAAVTVIALDQVHADIEACDPSNRPRVAEEGVKPAYLIYTSGTTGQPKGVVVTHANICNFIEVASDCYGYGPGDRVFQGLSQAFDFAVEETWVPLAAGATLVPAPQGGSLIGQELHEFLVERRVTALCCVPTLLATLPTDLPGLDFLLVSGEACPTDVIAPWILDGRRVLNAYGPTETTVTATWSALEANQPVTIGGPLPTYAVVVAEPGQPLGLPRGQIGEICVSGRGVTAGYLNRAELTAATFVPDFVGLDATDFSTWYRTGDLGRINEQNHLEFLGRIDTQVKINGYRIELAEIETVIRKVAGVAQVAVQPFDPEGRGSVLAAYVVPEPLGNLDFDLIDRSLRQSLPGYMVPVYYETLESLPMLANSKFDRDRLPIPTTARWTSNAERYVEASTETEANLERLLCGVLGVERISAEADFFDDLGANSLTMAAYVAELRKSIRVRRMSMKLIYQNSSIRKLAARIDELLAAAAIPPAEAAKEAVVASTVEVAPDSVPAPAPRDYSPTAPGAAAAAARVGVSRLQHFGFGFAQAIVMGCFTYVGVLSAVISHRWVVAADGFVSAYLRSTVSGGTLFVGAALALIAVKWLAVGRFDAAVIPLWSLRHLRFWVARLAIHVNPLNLFRGSPVYNLFLRSLGARVGPRTIILSAPPTCTDLVTIGAGTIIRESAQFLGYKVRGGLIHPGPIRVGSRAVISEGTYLDIDSRVGDDSQLGTTSVLLAGQVVPPGEIYQGSPAEPSPDNFCQVEALEPSPLRRGAFTFATLAWALLISAPLPFLLSDWIAGANFTATEFGPATGSLSQAAWLAISAAGAYFGSLLAALLTVTVVPRVLHRFVISERVHPLFGVQHLLANGIARISNNKLLNTVFGDSSMILGYLRLVGYDLRATTQTGSNFGVDQQHHTPFLCVFNRNTLVSDGLRMLNTETSATSFVSRKVVIPADTYLGNDVFYPADAAVGDNCLIATKAAIPLHGPARTNVGILGSPPFEIPRSVKRDQQFDHLKQPGVIESRLRLKLRSNLVTLGLYFLRSWLLVWVALAVSAIALSVVPGERVLARAAALTLAAVISLLAATLISIFAERLVRGFRHLEPQFCSLYDREFWNHERFWKLNYNAFLQVFDGTPMKPIFLRMQGAQVGAQLFDDGSGLTEPSLVAIGDYCTLNFGSAIQSHSLEDGTFKSDRIRIGDGCTVGAMALVHYGAQVNDGAVIEPDSFIMKGSQVEEGSLWLGNPARNVGASSA